MAEVRGYGLTPQLDINQIGQEAQSRWLRPAEICEILKNYQTLQISPEPPNRPPSGSLFLFDRKVLRYFRKDGHNWRKKRDGKTVKEAHEKLKAGSVDVLHCYYAHGEENSNFQRRTYWMLEEEFMHIVLVHYREVRDKKETYGRTRDVEEVTRNLYDDRPVGSNSSINYHQILSNNADGESQNSGQTSEYEDAEQDTSQASSRYHPFPEFGRLDGHSLRNINHANNYPILQHSIGGNDPSQRQIASGTDIFSVSQEDITTIYDNSGFGVTINGPKTDVELLPWEAVWKQYAPNFSDVAIPPASSGILNSVDDFQKSETGIIDGGFADGLGISQEVVTDSQGKAEWQELAHVAGISKEGNLRYASLLKQLSLDFPNVEVEKGLQKHDSFSKWIARELDDVDDTPKPSTRLIWDVVEGEDGAEDSCLSPQQDLEYLMSPSLSQDQLFSINYVTPSWAFADSETTVFVSGTFLTSKEDIQKVNWSCMFGQNEVCAEAVGDGLLRCLTPVHKPGRFHFYVTCSNRLACSEVREFEFHADDDLTTDSNNETLLYLRLERLLSSTGYLNQIPPLDAEKIPICNKISSLLIENNYCFANVTGKGTDEEFTSDTNDELLQKFLKGKLHMWLLQKVIEDGKGPNVMDKEGQGVIHLAAALDYDWAIAPIVAAGVNINFRDARGWTALHWAAAFGREKTIVALLSLDADPGLLTDPTPEFPSGRTPADLSSSNGHKGIAGFLAESSLTKHLSSLDLKETGGSGIAGSSSFVPVDNREGNTNQVLSEDLQSQQSLKDSLGAVRNAAQTYARIFQMYRMQSFHRKKLAEYEHSNFGGIPEEEALSLIAVKANKTGQRDDPVHAAATRIQNKFRGWKGRREFLVIRQHIVKIQAHIRGYQVRKHYRKVVWSVLIVEKAILRWRRKGSGLRGFRSEGSSEVAVAQLQMQPDNNKEDDYAYLHEGRKQTEVRLQRALARVKSMVQYPEARDQYQRLVAGVKESKKVMLQRILSESEETNDDLMFDIDELVADDAYMSTT